MMNEYVQFTRQGWLGRLGGSVMGVLLGLILLPVAAGVLFWNEGRAVHRAKALAEGAASVVTVDAKAVNPANDHKLVHFTGDAAGQTLADPDFGVSRDAIHLRRVVEMYQWTEDKKEERHKDTVGGGTSTKTTYTYKPVWSEQLVKTDGFSGPGRTNGSHNNPPALPLDGRKWDALVAVGAFRLPTALADEIDWEEPLRLDDTALANVPGDWKSAAVIGGSLYRGYRPGATADPANPRVGDVRVSFKVVPPGPVSVMAEQAGDTVAPYQASTDTLFVLHKGTRTAGEMIRAEETKNSVLAWVLRAVGFLVMWIGLAVILHPLKVLADVVGLIGDIAGVGVFLVSGVVAFALSVAIVAVAWVFYRPVLGVGLLAVAAGGFAYAVRLRRQGAAWRANTLPPIPPAMATGPLPPLPR